MERSIDDNPLRSERSRASGERPLQDAQVQSESKHPGPSTQNSSFTAHGSGSQYNAPGGTQNISEGNGNQFPGANFHGPTYFGTKEPFDSLRDCLRSLAFPEMDSRFHDIDTAAQGTCQWLLRHEKYTSWASCDRGLLWIKGKPGSGKSTLLRYVLDHVMATGEGALILSFFFHGRGSELQKTPLGLFQSLLHQLLRQVSEALTDLLATFQQRCETVGKPGKQWQWHPRELPRFFESSLLKVLKTRPVWVFIDALDECGKENGVKLAEDFDSMLQRLPSSGLRQFHICFTCRHYPILNLDGVFEVWVEKENRKDISTFVQDKLSSFRKRTSSTIPDLITNRADGVFLWAWLVVNQVLDFEREGVGLMEIEAKIRSVPQELDNLYHELIRNMGWDSLKLVQWICFATRSLSLDELQWAMIIDADCPHKSLQECKRSKDYMSDSDRMKRRVQTLSCGLAEVTPSSDTKVVQFIHQSVKDFFVEKGLSALDGTAKTDFVGIAHHRLSRACIRYLAMEEIGRSASRESYRLRSKFPFLHYATTSWVAHTKQSDARGVPQEDLLEYFAGSSNTLMERWVRIYRILEKYSRNCPPEGTSLVHVTSRYGVTGALRVILERAVQVGINIDGKDSHGRTSLSYTAERGHEAVVQLLLDTNKVDIDSKDKDGRTPLSWAAQYGHIDIAWPLLERGADANSKNNDGRTPLSWAAFHGHEAVVQLLLMTENVDVDLKDNDGRTPLSWAAFHGHEDVVMLLLTTKADANSKDNDGQAPLSWAAFHGHDTIVQLLLMTEKAEVDSKDKDGRTPLLWAAKRGHEAVVKLLLMTENVDVDLKDNDGRTPLLWAAFHGHEVIVKLLLMKKANANSKDNDGQAPLSWAAQYGHIDIAWPLLEWGADANSKDNNGRTPLSWAAQHGHIDIAWPLLEWGADANSKDNNGRTPLSWAAQHGHIHGHIDIVQLLLERGADANSKNNDGRTPLSWAAQHGHIDIVQLLLEWGADANSKDNNGRTPLS